MSTLFPLTRSPFFARNFCRRPKSHNIVCFPSLYSVQRLENNFHFFSFHMKLSHKYVTDTLYNNSMCCFQQHCRATIPPPPPMSSSHRHFRICSESFGVYKLTATRQRVQISKVESLSHRTYARTTKKETFSRKIFPVCLDMLITTRICAKSVLSLSLSFSSQ